MAVEVLEMVEVEALEEEEHIAETEPMGWVEGEVAVVHITQVLSVEWVDRVQLSYHIRLQTLFQH
jgi:hypothetical protein